MRRLPLEGKRVVDLTHLWAGPLCTAILARLGAEVTKIAGPRHPDPLGLLDDPPYGQPGYEALNSGKREHAIDLGTTDGEERFLDLLDDADGVVDNFSPRALRNWGLDPRRLARRHRVVWVSMPSFPTAGPLGDFASRGPGVEGASGLAALHASDGVPGLLDVPLTDPLAGLRAAYVFLSAIRSGRFTHYEVAHSSVARDVVELASLDGPEGVPYVPPIRQGTVIST
jgi:crotonobetainyl-CoA:carnitine CoA-transferase CaiB-like acyl-CoA transferase